MAREETRDVAPPPWLLRGEATVIPFRRGVLAFLRYLESNVGPYDELLWLEPLRQGPGGRAHRVPAIYVSSPASVRSGRANWGLPKELADFAVTPQGAGLQRVEVTHAGQPLASFLRTAPHGGLPLDTSKLPAWTRRLVQERAGRRFETIPEGIGRWELSHVTQLEVQRTLLPGAHGSRWRLALQLSQLDLRFPAAHVSEAAGAGEGLRADA